MHLCRPILEDRLLKTGDAGVVEISQALAEGKENTGNAGRWFRVGRIRVGREFYAATRPGIVQPDASAATRFPAIRQVPAGRIVSGFDRGHPWDWVREGDSPGHIFALRFCLQSGSWSRLHPSRQRLDQFPSNEWRKRVNENQLCLCSPATCDARPNIRIG